MLVVELVLAVVWGLTLVAPVLALGLVAGSRLSPSPQEIRPPAIPIANQPNERTRTTPWKRIQSS